METEFEPAVRTEETPEARIVEIDLPGFRREELKVQVNSGGNLVISGERGAKETEERKAEKVQRVGQRFRKVISVPQNLNLESVTAKFRNGKLRVSLPSLHFSEQQSQGTLPGGGKADQSLQSNVDRSSPAGQEGSRKESPAPAQDDQSARHPEAIRQGDDKEKPTVAAEKSSELPDEKKAKAPEQAKELVGEPPISTHAQAVSEETASAQKSECIQLKSKPDVGRQLQEDGGQKSGIPPEIRGPIQEKKEEAGSADEGKAAEKDDDVVGKEGNGDGVVEGYIRRQREEKKDDEKCSTCRSSCKFPDLKRIPFPASCSSTFSERGLLIASTVVVLSVGLYITYKSRSRHHI
eukprot:PITA_16714